ncbi:hypothetical protein TI39_contig5925g00003 [Zymoseptoria brevis]|uniref:Uncharacterized protein n=1 Tax=Zymoseptoria brevis TaxID=1047168 RepID=A0A0F4G470_9PEZI|nr:hypothetical protein TI39_contig5925g00003 [Zymoseptoria brevis]
MSSLPDLLSQYPILTSLSEFVSTLDLHHLALTSQACRAPIEQSFETLKRNCLCDGRGLAQRKTFSGPSTESRIHRPLSSLTYRKLPPYFDTCVAYHWPHAPIEVRLWNTVCDTTDTLPCQQCGINICEECRVYNREDVHLEQPQRRPHIDDHHQVSYTFGLCPTCDATQEEELQGRSLNELCDCDRYRRWICQTCAKAQHAAWSDYARVQEYTEDPFEWQPDEEPTKQVHVGGHLGETYENVYCKCCRATVPDETRMRCWWCKRRHIHDDDWIDELSDVANKQPILDEMDPCFPTFIGQDNSYYPKLAYNGPIWTAPQPSASSDVKADTLSMANLSVSHHGALR